MKKFSFIMCLVAIFVLTGCGKSSGSDKIVCTMTEEESGVEMKQEITANFKSDKLESASFVMTAVLPDEYKSYKSLFISTLESQFSSYEDTYGVKVNVNETSDGVKVEFNMDKASYDEIYGSTSKDTSKKETISELESAGFTCK